MCNQHGIQMPLDSEKGADDLICVLHHHSGRCVENGRAWQVSTKDGMTWPNWWPWKWTRSCICHGYSRALAGASGAGDKGGVKGTS